MRTEQEILARIAAIQSRDDHFGTEQVTLAERLSASSHSKSRDRESVLLEMCEEMPYAWGQANHLTANTARGNYHRTLAWIWLAGDDDLLIRVERSYSYHGKPQLREICEYYAWDWRPMDDDLWWSYEGDLAGGANDIPRSTL